MDMDVNVDGWRVCMRRVAGAVGQSCAQCSEVTTRCQRKSLIIRQ